MYILYILGKVLLTSVFFKVWLEEPLSNFEKALIFFLLFLSILSFVYTIVVAIAVPAQKILGGNEVLPKFCDVCPNHDFRVHFGYDKKIV